MTHVVLTLQIQEAVQLLEACHYVYVRRKLDTRRPSTAELQVDVTLNAESDS